jgi:hypothetical protein
MLLKNTDCRAVQYTGSLDERKRIFVLRRADASYCTKVMSAERHATRRLTQENASRCAFVGFDLTVSDIQARWLRATKSACCGLFPGFICDWKRYYDRLISHGWTRTSITEWEVRIGARPCHPFFFHMDSSCPLQRHLIK